MRNVQFTSFEKEMARDRLRARIYLFLPATVLYLGACILLLRPGSVSSLILCEGECANATELEVCQAFPVDRTPLPVMGLFPCNVESFRARGFTVAAQMAVRAILANTTILPNYRIELIVSNTMCSGMEAIRAFMDQLLSGTRYMIIGPGCSTGAVRIAEMAPFHNLTQISYSATSITLSDTERFPNFFRTISSDNSSIAAFSAIIEEYGWDQVAIITQINERFSNLTEVTSTQLERDGVNVLTEQLSLTPGITNTRSIVQQLNTSGVRIVILHVFEDIAREIFCAAYQRGMVYPNYVFLSFYWYTEFWWRDPIPTTRPEGYTYDPPRCTAQELERAIYRSLAPDYFPVAAPEDDNRTSDVGYTPLSFWEEFESNIEALGYPESEAIREARYAYDAVWAAALALHNVSLELENGTIEGVSMNLTDFNTGRGLSGDINNLILAATREINFRGVSGEVAFNQFGDRESSIRFFQYRFSGDANDTNLPDPFARLDPDTQRVVYTPGESPETVFPGGIPEATTAVLMPPSLCEGECAIATELDVCQFPPMDRTPLPVMGLFPCNVGSFRARGLTVAAQMAVRAILANTTILPNYRIELIVNNTMCSGLEGVRAFISQLFTGPIFIIGPGCSTGAVRIAEITPFYNLTQISYTATSITLSDTQRFPNFFRTISSDNSSIAAFSATIEEYGWEQVAIITQINELFSNLTAVTRTQLENDGVNVLTERLALTPGITDTRSIVQQLNTSGARIVILNVFEDIAREIFCAAYRRGMVYPNYVFLSFYWYTEFWWRDPIPTTRPEGYTYDPPQCTAQELERAIFRSLAPDYFPVAAPEDDNRASDVGFTPLGFWQEFVRIIEALGYPAGDAIRQARYAYDAVWATALALHNVSLELERGAIRGEPMSLTDFNTARGDINDLILAATREINFRGVSGKVAFNRFGDRETSIQFFQYRFSGDASDTNLPDPFGRLDPDTQRVIYFPGESPETVFPGRIPEATKAVLIHPALFGVYTSLAILGIVFAIICLIFNLVYRKKQVVKLSSPYLNVFIIVGAIFLYVTVIILGVDKNVASFDTVDALCQTQIWMASIGFSLFFGTILAKTWRVYYIFSSVRLHQSVKDWILFLMVAALLAIDVVFLIIVTVWRLRLEQRLVSRDNGDVPLLIGECKSDEADYWVPVLLAYKAVLLLIGIFLAIETYKVKIKQLRDSKLIVASVFFIAVVSVVDTIVALLLTDLPNATYGLLGGFILILATAVLVLLFVTKMIELRENPSGKIQVGSVPDNTNLTNLTSVDNTAKIAELQENVRRLQSQIAAIKSRRPEYQPMQTPRRAADNHSTNGEDGAFVLALAGEPFEEGSRVKRRSRYGSETVSIEFT